MKMLIINRGAIWHGFIRSNYITALWNWFTMLAGKAAEPVLFASVLYSGYELVPGVPQPTPGINATAFVIQQAALDVGGLGLIKLTKDAGKEEFRFARYVGYALLTLLVVNMVTSTAGKVFAVPGQAMQVTEGVLLIVRSIFAVLFGHAIHTLKDEGIGTVPAPDIEAMIASIVEQKAEEIKAFYQGQVEAFNQRLEELQKPVIPTVIPTQLPTQIPVANPALKISPDSAGTNGKITDATSAKTLSTNAVSNRRAVTVKDATAMLGLSESYVRDLRKNGTLKRSSSNANLILVSSILEYQQARKNAGKNNGKDTVSRPAGNGHKITQPLDDLVPVEV